jgi:hypothetical protein
MRVHLSALLLLSLLTGCMHVNDRQVIGSSEASFPLRDGDTFYHYGPVKTELTSERAAELTGPEVLEINAAVAIPDPDTATQGEKSLRVRRVGHCYEVSSSNYVSFLHVKDTMYLASMSTACHELGTGGQFSVALVRIISGNVSYLGFKEGKFESWAKNLNALQRFWHDVEILSSGKVSVESADAYIAFLDDGGFDDLVEVPNMYTSNTPPNPAQSRAMELLLTADRRKQAREAAAAQAQARAEANRAYAQAPQSYSYSLSPGRVRDFDPGDVVVLDTGWGAAGWVDVQVVSIRDEYPQIKVRHVDNGRTEWVSANRLKTADQIRTEKTKMTLTLMCVFATDPGKCAQEMSK